MASKEYTLKYLQERIRANKRQKGFPLDNVELDLAYLIEELGEMARALRRGWHEVAHILKLDAERAVQRVLTEFEERFPREELKGHHGNLRAGGVDYKYQRRK